jgi:hypothetical protein
VQTHEAVACYTLGHDVVGLALKQWSIEEDTSKAASDRVLATANVVSGMIASVSIVLLLFDPNSAIWWINSLCYGAIILLTKLRPDLMRSMLDTVIRIYGIKWPDRKKIRLPAWILRARK